MCLSTLVAIVRVVIASYLFTYLPIYVRYYNLLTLRLKSSLRTINNPYLDFIASTSPHQSLLTSTTPRNGQTRRQSRHRNRYFPLPPHKHPTNPFPGAGSGFGAGIALRYAAEGAKVLVCDINESTAQTTASKDSANLSAFKMDVTKRADWQATMQECLQKYGRCDILVNNAGWSYTNKPTAEVTEDEFERVFDVNVKGVYLGCQAWVGQAVERKEGGVIVNIASVGATRPRPGLVWYNASKGAVWNVRPGYPFLLSHLTICLVG